MTAFRCTLTSVATAAVLGGTLITGGCSAPGPGGTSGAPDLSGATVSISAVTWTGAPSGSDPEPAVYTIQAQSGAQLETGGEMRLLFEVTEVNDGSVVARTSSPMAPAGESGGANLNSLRDEFWVVPGFETLLFTPTMDAGIAYTLTVEDVA